MSKTPATFNPYAPPKAAFAPGTSIPSAPDAGACWREDDILIAPVDAHLPPRCVKCNRPATMDSPRAYLWHHPGWYALMPVLVYMVVCLFVRKRAVVVLGLCSEHRRRRHRFSILAHAACPLGAIGLLGACALGNYWAMLPAGVLLLIGIQFATASARLLVPVRITNHHIHLKGCAPGFLDSLPTLEQQRT
ncbi:hypothetical protein F2P45_25330 [Massilia sp. CCM 8733]|uniref:Uncharacterized protein n=1 Tax=Massilia mucilaginosa TaxID=2609282 RepID=A0ABX0NZG7_9BURK|nr:hypothetical protein [Massilia mucilaginosa]NHZ92302.1 hypothetical protein [Massilia mucilaginosa]